MFGKCLTTDRHYIACSYCGSHFRTRVPDSYCLESTGKKNTQRLALLLLPLIINPQWTVTDSAFTVDIGGHLTNHVFVYRNKDRSNF